MPRPKQRRPGDPGFWGSLVAWDGLGWLAVAFGSSSFLGACELGYRNICMMYIPLRNRSWVWFHT